MIINLLLLLRLLRWLLLRLLRWRVIPIILERQIGLMNSLATTILLGELSPIPNPTISLIAAADLILTLCDKFLVQFVE